MFDLIEEALFAENKQTKEPQQTQSAVLLQSEPVVFAMPEKLREKPTRKSKAPLIVALVFFALMLIGGTVATLILLSQPEKPLPVVKDKESQAAQSQADIAPKQEPVQEPIQEVKQQEQPVNTPSSTLVQEPLQNETTSTQEQKQEVPPVQSSTPSPEPQSAQGVDTDGDSLTDAEERLFSTDASKPDTDNDGYSDGDEINRLYDPTRPQGARLESSGLVNTYTNQTFKYSLYSPSSWIAQRVNVAEKEVVISTASGEFFSIIAQENPDHLTAMEWYTKVVSPQANTAQVLTITSETWTAVKSLDGLTAYITRNATKDKDGGVVIVIKYNTNNKSAIEFSTTLQMMLKSFIFTDLSFTRK